MIAEILTIGDELMRGEIVDSNKAVLAERLLRLEIETHFQSSVRDDPDDMRDAFLRARERADVVLVSGGLGPTRDDLTIEVLARTFGRELALHEPSLAEIRAFFARLGREMAEINAKQAWLPVGADVLPNPVGTAPGCALEAPRDGGRAPAVFFCLPGVPRELVRMMDEQVVPRIEARLARAGRPPRAMRAVLLRTFGLGESNLDQELRDVAREADVALGFRTAFPDNYLRPVARGATAEEAEARLAKVCDAIRERLGAIVYGTGEEETMEHVVGALLAARGLTLATAESCSGGLVGERLTAVPGASRYYRGGVVAYANEAKRDLLGVPAALLERHGAVSSQVARAMAEGARARFGVDLAVSTTGISGPDGGTPEKPVGLVFVGFASPEGSEALELFLPLDRERHRSLTAQIALDRVRRHLLGEPPLAPRFGRERA
ncbi:MAG TPA: competence/damage-inducible protein A [Myxococcota bacterium]|nr:competence/damage-inducible protein A [Myxococcota bacterium]